MDKGTAVKMLIVGSICLYFSIFGLVTPFQLQLTSGFTDNFDDGIMGAQWMVPSHAPSWASPSETGGVLLCTGATTAPQGYVTQSQYALSSSEISVDVVQFTGDPTFVLMISDTNEVGWPEASGFSFRIQRDKIYDLCLVAVVDGTQNWLVRNLAFTSGKWQMKISAGTIKAYVSGSEVYSYNVPVGKGLNLYASLWIAATTGTVSFDNFGLTIGGGPPPPPDTYTLTVKAKYASGTSWLDLTGVPVTVTGQTQQNTPATFNLASGTYTVTVSATHGIYTFYQWENGATSTSRTMSLTQNIEITAYYRTGDVPPPPPPPNGDGLDIIGWINNLFANATVKTLLLIAGVACVGYGAIGLVLPSKPKYYPPSVA